MFLRNFFQSFYSLPYIVWQTYKTLIIMSVKLLMFDYNLLLISVTQDIFVFSTDNPRLIFWNWKKSRPVSNMNHMFLSQTRLFVFCKKRRVFRCFILGTELFMGILTSSITIYSLSVRYVILRFVLFLLKTLYTMRHS